MANNSLRYSVTRYGTFEVETIIDTKTEEVFIGRPALEKMLGWESKRGYEKLKAKKLKAFNGGRLVGTKNLKAPDTTGRIQEIVVLTLSDALTVIYWELQNKSPEAQRLLLAGFADSFTSQAFEQAGLEYSLEKRKELLAFYLTDYHELFDWIRDTYVELYGVKPPHSVYQAINKATNREIRDIENCQRYVMRKIKQKGLKGDPVVIVPELVRQF